MDLLWLWQAGGFPPRDAQALGTRPSVAVARGLSGYGFRGLQDVGPRVVVMRGLWLSTHGELPGPGIKPVSPALAGGFLSTGTTREALVLFLSLGI